jgi:hypothetical protein
MGHSAQGEQYWFVEQGADYHSLGRNDRVGVCGDSGDLDPRDGLQRQGVRVEDLVGRRESQLVERVEGGRESSSVRAPGVEPPVVSDEQSVNSLDGRC